VEDLQQELQPGSRIVETDAYGLRIYGPWFCGGLGTDGTGPQHTCTVVCNEHESKDFAADARIATVWADEPHLLTTEFLANHSCIIFLFDSATRDDYRADDGKHESQWLLVDARARPFCRLGIVWANFCLYRCLGRDAERWGTRPCKNFTCKDLWFIQEPKQFHIE